MTIFEISLVHSILIITFSDRLRGKRYNKDDSKRRRMEGFCSREKEKKREILKKTPLQKTLSLRFARATSRFGAFAGGEKLSEGDAVKERKPHGTVS